MATPIPQVDNGKRPEDPILAHVHLLPLPSNTPYGNLALKSMKIVMRIDWLNQRIQDAYASYARARSVDPIVAKPLEHQLIAEEVVYWVRKTADELIGICDFLLHAVEAGEYPNALRIDSIGSALACRDSEITAHLLDFTAFLAQLNDISNAYKHSFINSDVTLLGRDEPVVFALALKHNRLEASPVFHVVALSQVVRQFSEFYVRAVGLMAELSKGLPARMSPTGRGAA